MGVGSSGGVASHDWREGAHCSGPVAACHDYCCPSGVHLVSEQAGARMESGGWRRASSGNRVEGAHLEVAENRVEGV